MDRKLLFIHKAIIPRAVEVSIKGLASFYINIAYNHHMIYPRRTMVQVIKKLIHKYIVD